MNKNGYTLIEVMIMVIFFVVISFMIGLTLLVVRGCNYVREKGVKNVAVSVWEGQPNTNNQNEVVLKPNNVRTVFTSRSHSNESNVVESNESNVVELNKSNVVELNSNELNTAPVK